jgi:hypothetical protein
MSEQDAQTIIRLVAKKHPTFRHIETRCHAIGASISFAPLEKPDPRAISGWFTAVGAHVLYIGREWKINGYVMHIELRE